MPAKTVEDIYQKKTQHEHILSRPDMYIGTIQPVTEEIWVFDEALQQMRQRQCTWIPGLYKIFDEILVNASDNKVRDESQTAIKVTIDEKAGMIRVWNNGEGIPVQKHKQHNLWIPEMIFGHLLTSSNYDDSEDKITGGRNGFGAKLTNVFSRKFEVETCHARSRKKFRMQWTNNMLTPSEPEISTVDVDASDYTQITFYPDFEKFGISGLDEDIVLMMKRRVYDIAGCTHSSLKCYLNGTKLPFNTFQEYVELYPTLGEEKKGGYARVNNRWEVCVRVSNIGQQQVSFVNSIATTRGGNHVRYITDQIVTKVVEQAKKKSKVEVKPHMIKQHLWVFINCLINNPGFDSQTKETLNTTRPNFGSTCELPNAMIDYILKSGLVERAITVANSKLTKEMAAKLRSGDRKRITGIPKLEDANDAGGKYSSECTLILTEGDSAKSLCMAGLSVVGKDRFGVFPLRGKPLNVRDASLKKVAECEEIQSVMKIVGLDVRQKYTNTDSLRYGHIMIMSDQDHDGSHIKGLVINFIHHYWPELFALPGFLQQFITPIVRVWDPRRSTITKRSFYSLPEYLAWKKDQTPEQLSRLTIRYFKGLGTSEPEDGRDYFSNIGTHRLEFVRRTPADDERVVMAFSKDKIEERKNWITAFAATEADVSSLMDYTVKRVPYADFIDKELILFSIADCERSIPSVVDGLKPGQRKIMFSCFKRNLTRAIKVSQLAGYVSEQSAYHHGEASLHSTIIGLAQNFIGSNNLNLLKPEGTFGSRLAGGKDSAAARYIFTALSEVSRHLYNKNDDFILTYRDDDGLSVEPHYYVPIIPVVLVNGTSGIGTGFATSIPNYSPLDIIANIRRLLDGHDVTHMTPWYWGHKGEITEREKGKFISKGRYTIQHDGVITITELPVGVWTNQYKKNLEDMMEKDLVITFRDNNSDTAIDFDVMLHPDVLRAWQEQGILEEKLGLVGHIHATNIIAFNIHGQLTKYADAESVLKEHYLIRLEHYQRRKDYLIGELEYDCSKLANMVRFVSEVVNGQLIVTKRTKKDLLEDLKRRNYRPFPPKQKKKVSSTTIEEAKEEADDAEKDPLALLPSNNEEVNAAARDYDYLLGMRLWSLTAEMIEHLQNQLKKAEQDLDGLKRRTTKDLWRDDLDTLEAAVKKQFELRANASQSDGGKKRAHKRVLEGAKVKIPILSDKARALIKPTAKMVKAMKVEELDENGEPIKPAKKPAPKRKKKKDSDDDDDSDDSFDDVFDEAPAKPARKPRAAKVEKEAPAAKKPRAEAKSVKKEEPKVINSIDDDDDWDNFGLASLVSTTAPPAKQPAPKLATPSSNMFDDEEDLLLMGSAVKKSVPIVPKPAPKAEPKKAPAKKAPAKKRGRKSDSESSDDSSESDSSSDSDSGSDSSEDWSD